MLMGFDVGGCYTAVIAVLSAGIEWVVFLLGNNHFGSQLLFVDRLAC